MDYYLLTELAARIGYHLALSGAETVSYTHLDVYKRQQHISSAREAVARMLKSFSEDGLVELRRGAITLRNKNSLNRLK